MSALKTMLMISLGLGTTWLAWQIAPASSSGMLTGVAYAQGADKEEPATGPTDAEIDEQLARIDAALAKVCPAYLGNPGAFDLSDRDQAKCRCHCS